MIPWMFWVTAASMTVGVVILLLRSLFASKPMPVSLLLRQRHLSRPITGTRARARDRRNRRC